MSDINNRLNEISDKMRGHIITVKGTLEVLDASVSEDDLSNLIARAIERMDDMQKLSDELFAALKQALEKLNEAKESKEP